MAPRGRKRAGLMREDAARDAMRALGFEERIITVSIKGLLEVYGEEGWFLIEGDCYQVLLDTCLEQATKLDEEQKEEMAKEQNEEIAEEEHEQTAQEEEKEQEQQIEDGRDHVGSNSTSLVGCGAETGTQTCQTDCLSITSETVILDSSPATFQLGDASAGYAHHSVRGSRNSQCGWLSEEEEETDPKAASAGDDDEIIQLTPEPLCEELEELLREVRGEKKRKKLTRWDN
ncbi:hypothetical protein EUTSA_v10017194mg [Eutrema salsugineum]|uniref:WIYLD domain-containing protein n=1 Tax=Eutrema salsugineum TaxID=72664 RepID=V4LQ52_EUTSA|nr:hypothetical protein EUTSA_v10017194mg [Eutrema salsugineum]